MPFFQKLLGENLVGSAGTVPTSSLSQNEVIGIYFSAHWCGPCRRFTPQLTETYNKLKSEGKKFEVVFVSSDKDEKSFKDYFGSMPWLALPFENRDLKAKLSRKYKVEGIPTLVLLTSEGHIMSTEGTEVVSDDPQGNHFPWKPKAIWEILPSTLINNNKQKVDLSTVKQKPYIGLYFSAHWCPPCRAFTPQLVQTYKKLQEKGKDFEIIFVSSDKDQSSFDEYFGTMPWLALPLENKSEKLELSKLFGVSGIPTFVVLSSSGEIITKTGRAEVSSDPEGDNFPWSPQPVNDLNAAQGLDTALIFFTPKEDEKKELKEILLPISQQYKTSEDAEDLEFFFSSENLLIGRIREVTGGRLSFKSKSLAIINSSEGVFYEYNESDLSTDGVKSFIQQWKEGKIASQPLVIS